ncbi:hypothetical protein KKC83_04765 [Patescibacteria group bacterium]|nr:hypothetical protein [Candidatus Falkowbacteria bacterium]MBU3905412.1 hypothetical protein [Patescibacteria group bacterium]MCG2697661.1 hypothetical protein [Candidatus Parcubacteria bacterium]MBU4015044.1 hypothetical protein [Patescibacteria group bacterium]MBU4026829.1 hypothetical protein [Patescibacteria group bacterium]
MAKNFKKRRDKKWKKKAKKNKTSLLSSSGQESKHYALRSVSRSGFFQPVRKKVTKKEMKNGHVVLKKLTRGRRLIINYRTGSKQVVSKNFKGGITFINST